MGVREQLRDRDKFEVPGQQQPQGEQNAQEAAASNQGSDPGPAGLGPVLDWEKTDVEFWMQVGQFVLLLLILRELRGGSF